MVRKQMWLSDMADVGSGNFESVRALAPPPSLHNASRWGRTKCTIERAAAPIAHAHHQHQHQEGGREKAWMKRGRESERVNGLWPYPAARARATRGKLRRACAVQCQKRVDWRKHTSRQSKGTAVQGTMLMKDT